MTKKRSEALRRSDKILVGALAMVLAAASAAVGATAAYHPSADNSRSAPAVSPAAMVLQNADANQVRAAMPAMANDASANAVPLERTNFASAAENKVLENLLKEHRCLSEALYYEARGEGDRGQKAVAEVIFHRLRTGNYGHSICAVVYEGAYKPGCQFSFTCNGMIGQKKNASVWMNSQLLAAKILTNEEHLNDITGGATSYHAISVQPDWAGYLTRTVQIGNHVFYKHAYGSRAM